MDWQERSEALRRSFTPAAPVKDQELFAGRQSQLVRVADSFVAPGEHAAIFGERGVGKTSLASIAEVIATVSGRLAVRINCQANDSFDSIAHRLGEAFDRRLRVDRATGRVSAELGGVVPGAVELLTGVQAGAPAVLTALEMLASVTEVVIFLDEFDRLGETTVHTDLVDLMKTLSDHVLPITIVVVGVASNVDSLIDEHESIGRGLNEIEMPRMSAPELQEVITRGLNPAGMTASPDATEFVAQLSIGLPHYTHLMALQAGLQAVADESSEVRLGHVLTGLAPAVNRAQQHVARLYHQATHSTQANLLREVLLAACLTPTDDRGYFAPGDVRAPLAEVLGRRMEIPSFAGHLSAFAGERGPVLEERPH